MIPWLDVPYMIASFIIFSIAFAIMRSLFGRMLARINNSEKPINWRKRFKRATKEDENDKKEKFIDIEKPHNGSSPMSGEPKDTEG